MITPTSTNSSTDNKYLQVIRRIQAHLFTHPQQARNWKDVSSIEVGRLFVKLYADVTASSWNVYLAAMKDFEEQLKISGIRTKTLVPEHLKFRKVPKRLAKPVPEAEVTRLLSVVTTPQDKLLFEVLLGSGLRAGEVGNIKLSDLDSYGVLTVIGKGDKERNTFIPNAGVVAWVQWIRIEHMKKPYASIAEYTQYIQDNPDKGLFVSTDGEYVRNLSRPADWVYKRVKTYTKYSPHQFRHFWVTDLLNNGADIMAVMNAAGHESISTTRGYLKVLKRTTTALRSKHSREQGRI